MEKILVIDDKDTLSALLAQFLGRNYEVVIKSNGQEAMEWLQESNMPDLIITDLQMPVMGGLEFIQKAKSSGFFSEIPIMVLSCKSGSNDRIECLRAGASDYMVKPFNPEELRIRIDNILLKSKI